MRDMTKLNVIDRVEHLIATDDGNKAKYSSYVEKKYKAYCSSEARDGAMDALNDIFITLCGYSLETIINNPQEITH